MGLSLIAAEIIAKSIAPMSATSPPVLGRGVTTMSDECFAGVLGYKSAIAQAGLMLSKGIITTEEYAIIDTMMAEKYGLCSCSLFRENDLPCGGTRGNMSHYKEVTKCQE